MAAPLWAKALKGVADTGTMLGNGLLLGQGATVKGMLGYTGDNLAKAAGLREGDYTPLADYIQSGAQDIANAREGSGSIGALAEGAGMIAGGSAIGGALLKGATKIPSLAKALLPKTPVVGELGPAIPKVDIGKTLKVGGTLLGGGLFAGGVASNAPELSDFTDSTTSSGTLPPKDGSAQVGAAAMEKSTEPQLTKGQQMMIRALSGMSFDRSAKLLQMEQIGATKPMSARDQMLTRLNAMLDNERLAAIQSGVDPRKANAEYLRNAGALVAPSGVPFLTSPEE